MFGIEQQLSKFKNKYLDSRFILSLDVLLSTLASFVVLSITILLSSDPSGYGRLSTLIWLLGSLVSTVLMSILLGTSKIIIRHTTFRDIAKFILVAVGKTAFIAVLMAGFLRWFEATGMMLVVDFLLTITFLLGMRLAMIMVYDAYKSRVRMIQKRKRILVYGTDDKSIAGMARLRNSKHFIPEGYISPDGSLKSFSFSDMKVFSFKNITDVENLAKDLSLTGIVFASESAAKTESDRLVRFCSELSLKSYILPSVGEVGDSQGSSKNTARVREVKIEDLLGREEIKISMDAIKARFSGKVVMVTGAAGSIGSELCRQLARLGISKLILFDNAETPMHNLRLELEDKYKNLNFVPVIGDVRLLPRLDFAFRTYRPQVVFHAAAYKHVPLMEDNPCEAVLVNVAGSRNVADKCIEYGVEKMVMISTDKAVNPTNIMGCTKRLAEIYVQSLGLAIENGTHPGTTKFVTTRFGNVLGSNGSVIPRFKEQIENGGPVTVTHPDITRFFMTIPEACRLVMEAATLPTENRICVFDMGESVKIDTLARKMIELSGLEPGVDIEIEYSGLRPGEKLYEEVLSTVENTEPTAHDRIRIAKVRSYDYAEASSAADRLEDLSRAVKIPEMVQFMKQIVPEFISKNSKFEIYDKQQ